ncbi:hypothetical protein, partial [Prochlorococcus marinus]|uniref:hypothetical protein n=1 Tax=Prochlorococcus marinus TaxID=1219 RepID=UPI000AD79DFC
MAKFKQGILHLLILNFARMLYASVALALTLTVPSSIAGEIDPKLSISDEPAFTPKQKRSGDPKLSISDEPAFTPKQKRSGDPKLSISDEPAFTPKQKRSGDLNSS